MFTGAKQGEDSPVWERSLWVFQGYFHTLRLFSPAKSGETDMVCQLLQWS